jgi:hypothetical protein
MLASMACRVRRARAIIPCSVSGTRAAGRGHHLVDPELEVGAQQVNGYRVPVRAADLLDAIPPLDRKRT